MLRAHTVYGGQPVVNQGYQGGFFFALLHALPYFSFQDGVFGNREHLAISPTWAVRHVGCRRGNAATRAEWALPSEAPRSWRNRKNG